jgi:hypothetical protein
MSSSRAAKTSSVLLILKAFLCGSISNSRVPHLFSILAKALSILYSSFAISQSYLTASECYIKFKFMISPKLKVSESG